MNKYRFIVGVAVLAMVALACGLGGGSTGATSATGYNTKFPLPASVSNFTVDSKGEVNFQTHMNLKYAVSFYRQSLTKAGLTERTINTAITDTTFSMVFDGDPSGQAIVVQGDDLGSGTTNVNIRYEKV